MHFTLRQLEYFVAAGERKSIKYAADRAHISQSAVSTAISQLEAEIGVPLLIRHHARGLSLTTEGEYFLREARNLLHGADELRSTALKISQKATISAEIGCLATQYHFIIPEVEHHISSSFENSYVKFKVGDQATLVEKLRAGEVSMALVWDVGVPSQLRYKAIARLPLYVFFASDHPLAGRERIDLREVVEEPFFLLDRPISRDYFLSLFRDMGLEPRIGGTFEQMEVIRSLAARGHGYGITNMPPKDRVTAGGEALSIIRLDGIHRELSLGIASRAHFEETPLGQLFYDVCANRVLQEYSIRREVAWPV